MPNRKITIAGKALEDADVNFISLVSRPANRIPYRILKAEDVPETKTESVMKHLNKLFSRKIDSDSDTGPTVAAVVIQKADSEALIETLKKTGVIVDQITEKDDLLILKQADFDENEVGAYRINDQVVLLIKQFDPFPETTDFSTNVETSGFLPGVHIATDALMDTIRNIIFDARSPDEAKTAMKTAVTSYGKFINKLADNLPEVAFKIEAALSVKADDDGEAVATPEVKPTAEDAAADNVVDINATAENGDENGDEEGDANGDDENGDEEGEDAAEDNGDEAAAVDDTQQVAVAKEEKLKEAVPGDHEEGLDTAVKADEPKAEVSSDDATNTAEDAGGDEESEPKWLAGFKTEVMAGISELKETVEKVKTDQEALSERVEKAEEIAKSADDAVRGTVPSGSDPIANDGLGNRARTMTKGEEGDDLWDGVLNEVVGGSR